MKKFLKIAAIVLIIIIVVVLCLAYWQKDNISSMLMAFNDSPEKIEEKIAQNDAAFRTELEAYMPENPREYTEEEKRQIESGEVSEKVIMAKIIAEGADNQPPTQTFPPSNPKPSQDGASQGPPVPDNVTVTPSTVKQKTDKIVSKYVSELYAMESQYVSGIEGVISRAFKEYVSIAKHNDDMAAKASVGAKFVGEIYALEASCDAEVNALLNEMKKELKAIGADTSIIGTIRSAYENEKNLKRSYYLNLYM